MNIDSVIHLPDPSSLLLNRISWWSDHFFWDTPGGSRSGCRVGSNVLYKNITS